MKKSDLYEVEIKIIGLYLFIKVIGLINELFSFITIMNQSDSYPGDSRASGHLILFIPTIVNFAVLTAFATLLTFNTKLIVKKVCRPPDFEEKPRLFNNKKEIYEIALTLAGFLSIIIALPDFLTKLQYHIQLVQLDQLDKHTRDFDNNFLISSALKIVLGILVIYYSRSISGLLTKENIKTSSEE